MQNIELTNAEKKELKQEAKEVIKKQSEKNQKNIIVKAVPTKEEKFSNFFDKIEFLSMDSIMKEKVAVKVKEESSGDRLYWIEIFLSSIIAALGLLQNSVAVVIGAMLIAPLLRPINGLSFSIARGGQKFFMTAFSVLFFSILASILMGYLVAKLVGLDVETTEVLARSSPNIIDFFIAIFSAMVAVMSLRFTKLGESIAGVAMAASLMPPLVVVGIELAIGNYMSSLGALTLFGANLVAILFVGIIFFWLYGFTPHEIRKQSKVFKRIALVFVSMIIILIPLVLSFNTIKTNKEIQVRASEYLVQVIEKDINDFEIYDIKIVKNIKNRLELKTVLKVPEDKDINSILKKINGGLSKEFNKEVKLDLEIIRVFSILSK